MRGIIFLLFSLFSLNIAAAEDYDRSQVIKRIKPIGDVRIKEDLEKSLEKSSMTKAAEEKKVEGQSPEKIYQQFCVTCHKTGLAGAPKFRDEADWKEKTAGRTIEELTATAIKGINAMPPKGTCMQCTEEDIKETIQYMLPQS